LNQRARRLEPNCSLLNGGMAVADMIDIQAMRRQSISFLDLILQLTRVRLDQLRKESPIGQP
jgi:kynureninase